MTPGKSTRSTRLRAATAAVALMAAGAAQAATGTLFNDRSAFVAALGGVPTATQNFESFGQTTNMKGRTVLPGVTASTSMPTLASVLRWSDQDIALFGLGRDADFAEYVFNVGGAYTAFGFDIEAYMPGTGPGLLSVDYTDGTTDQFVIAPTQPDEDTPLFTGVLAYKPIQAVTWREGTELAGGCCEETALDNLIAANPVPEPSTGALLAAGMAAGGLAASRRRRG